MTSPPLTVAVTGPTGEIGTTFIRALEQHDGHRRDPRHGEAPVRPGLDRAGSARRTSRATSSTATRSTSSSPGADVVVHLAFIIFGDARGDATRPTSRGRATCSRRPPPPGPTRLVYTSSVAAYGFHADNPLPLTEDVAAARQRELLLLGAEGRAGGRAGRGAGGQRRPTAYVFRPSHRRRTRVARPGRAPALRAGLGGAARLRATPRRRACPPRRRCCPTSGCRSSSCTPRTSPRRSSPRCSVGASPASTTSPPTGEITLGDIAREMGWHSVRAAEGDHRPHRRAASRRFPFTPTGVAVDPGPAGPGR